MELMDREKVIENIRSAVERREFDAIVEVGDPVLTPEEGAELRKRFCDNYLTQPYKRKRAIARGIANVGTAMITKSTNIYGLEKLNDVKGGAFITSNHFSPIDNAVVRKMTKKTGRSYLTIISTETNLAMEGPIGFLMNYTDIIPIAHDSAYLAHHFEPMVEDVLKQGDFVLIYPEQEMWFNYRKPRPCKRGTYFFAAKMNVPVISCFVEIIDKEKLESPNFVQVGYNMHILDVLYPDPALSLRENARVLCERDYALKVAAYERIYNKKLDYRFEIHDIAGWVPPKEVVKSVDEVRQTQEACIPV